MNDLMLQIILAVIAILGTLVTSVLVPYIKSKTTLTQQERIETLVELAVYAAEQIFNRPGAGIDKKEYVLSVLHSKGISIDEEQLEIIIEAAVYQMNQLKYIKGETLTAAD